MSRFFVALVSLLFVVGVAVAPPASRRGCGTARGAWISPDWLFPGTSQSYTEADVRRIAHSTLLQAKEQGINTIFFETMLRGTTICPTTTVSNGTVQLSDKNGSFNTYPVYKPLAYDFKIDNNIPVDTLQIFIEEAAPPRHPHPCLVPHVLLAHGQ